MEKWPQMAPNRARMFFPTNPDLADILGDTCFEFEVFYSTRFAQSAGPGLETVFVPFWLPF